MRLMRVWGLGLRVQGLRVWGLGGTPKEKIMLEGLGNLFLRIQSRTASIEFYALLGGWQELEGWIFTGPVFCLQ